MDGAIIPGGKPPFKPREPSIAVEPPATKGERAPSRSILTRLGVRRSEVRPVALIAGVFAVTTASHGLGVNAADALFFLRFGVDQLPLMILVSGLAVMVFLLAYTGGLALRGPVRWLSATTWGCSIWVMVEWVAARSDFIWVYPVIWVSTQVMIWVTFTVVWNSAESSCDTRQAKRLFPIFATAGVAGGVIGNVVTGPLASLIGTENLLGVQAALLASSAYLLQRARSGFHHDSSAVASIGKETMGAMRAIRSSRLLNLALIATFLVWTMFFLVVFPFSQAVASNFATEAEIAGFLGLFASIVTSVTFVVALLATNRIFARWGIVIALLLVPALYLGGFGLWLVSFGLVTASLVRGLQSVMVNGVWSTGFPAIFNVLSGRRRGQVMAFMIAVPTQLGTVAGGAILLFGKNMSNAFRFGLGLGLALAASIVVIVMRPAYVSAIVAAVRQGLVGVFTVPNRGVSTPIDGDAVRVLTEHLNDPRPEARAMAAAALAVADNPAGIDDVERLLSDESPEVRTAAFDSMCVLDPARVGSHVMTALSDPVPSVRIQALRYLAGNDGTQTVDLASPAIDDPDPEVRAAAIVSIGGDTGGAAARQVLESRVPSETRALLEEMARTGEMFGIDPLPFVTDADPRTRAAATKLGRHSLKPEVLVIGLDDTSHRVRKASALSLMATPAGRRSLLEVLRTASVNATDAALDALTMEGTALPEFVSWAGNEAERAAFLLEAARSLNQIDPGPSINYLADVLSRRAERLVGWVLRSMTTFENSHAMATVERGIRSDSNQTKAQAIEALETVGNRTVLTVLLPLLEPMDESEPASPYVTLRKLSIDFDPWLTALAQKALEEQAPASDEKADGRHRPDQTALPSWDQMTPDRLDTLGRMDRMLALQRVAMFSELDPEDLDLIAATTVEVHYEGGDRIYSIGEEAHSMMVIVSGSAIVNMPRETGPVTVAVYGPGDHIGELALLVGGPRTADVTAGDDGVVGVVVNEADLLSILEERPMVALGMLGTLARRLVDQSGPSGRSMEL